jgi:hypothetical protein
MCDLREVHLEDGWTAQGGVCEDGEGVIFGSDLGWWYITDCVPRACDRLTKIYLLDPRRAVTSLYNLRSGDSLMTT